ncbi:sialate:O-sulfotransferase 2-like [Ptychodera flava]|uniref:sialate:O-sulfotransferase 2-like n=1 Tax=Ptychodera flava TaxID=63121 RepID=UPI00396AAE19
MASIITKLTRSWRRRCTNRLFIIVFILVMTPLLLLSARYHNSIIDSGGNFPGPGDRAAKTRDQFLGEAINGKPEPAVRTKGVKDKATVLVANGQVEKAAPALDEQRQSPGVVAGSKTTKQQTLNLGGMKVIYKGCLQDDRDALKRTLQGMMWHDSKAMSVDACIRHCHRKNYMHAGLEFQSECWCSNAIKTAAANETGCSMPCPGNKEQICGGPLLLSVYTIVREPVPMPAYMKTTNNENETPSGTTDGYKGCVATSNKENIFEKGLVSREKSMTIAACKTQCLQKQYSIAALRGGNECHCGHLQVNFNYILTENDSLCEVPCGGFEGHFCGGRGYASVYVTAAEDPRCQNTTLKPEGSMSLVALASFPGSGNTWVRHIIERATGIYTGSFYTDGELFKKGFKGEREHWKKRNTVVVKTHDFSQEHIKDYDAVVLIIRNPYKAMIAEHNRKFGGHTGYATEDKYTKGTEWTDFVMGKSRTWTNTALMWMQHCPKVLVIHYEDLLSDINSQLHRLLTFLNIEISQERLLCAELNSSGKFKRPSRNKGLSFDPFTQEMHEYVDIYIKAVAMALKLHGHPPLPKEYVPDLNL